MTPPERSEDESAPLADVEIGATVRARKLRFRGKPKTRVEFEGDPDCESDSHTERENLPDEVEPGVTYRDVAVRWRGGARIVVRDPEGQLRGSARELRESDER